MVAIEQEVDKAILAQKRWADLDNRMRDLIGSSQEYDKRILKYSIENQLRYRGNLVRFVVVKEHEYYRDLLKYSRNHLMLFPYHLSDFIITGMRITPFQYYLSVMTQIIEQEKSYDTLPNFTAADCLRLLGIGRNQYIDIMNELRSTYRGFLGLNFKKNATSLLPNKPNENVPIEPWWFVTAGYITEDDVRSMVTPAEKYIIDRLVSPDGMFNQILACDLDEAHVRSLYIKGLIYLDVPIYDDDFIVIPPLEGFVMNRVTGDYFENLLYKIFVSIDQTTPVKELANILDLDIRLVKNAISMYCRLEFAYKKNIYIDLVRCHPSWLCKLNEYRRKGINVTQEISKASSQVSHFFSELASVENSDKGVEISDEPSSSKSCYNLSAHLKYRDEQSDIHQKGAIVASPSMLLTPSLQQGPISPPSSSVSTPNKIAFFYDSNLAAFLMMGNLSSKLKNHAVTMFEVGKLSDEWIDSLLTELALIKCDKLDDGGYEAKRYYLHAIMLHHTIEFIRNDLKRASCLNNNNINATINEDETLQLDNKARIGLDLIRVESLSNLSTESCERFLKKNYKLIISVAPLIQDDKLNATSSLPHIGPGSTLINSIWFRLYLYHLTGHGPPSLLLIQGYRLEKLPKSLTKYGTLLIHHWTRDPTCVGLHNALNIINEALTQSPVLVQAYPMPPVCGNLINGEEKSFVPFPFNETNKIIDPTSTESHELELQKLNLNDQLDLENCLAIKKLRECLDLSHLCGYVTLLKTGKWIDRLLEDEENACLFRTAKRRSDSVKAAAKLQSDQETDNQSKDSDQNTNNESIDNTTTGSLNDFILYDCNFGVPLFDANLNLEIRNRVNVNLNKDGWFPNGLVGSSKRLNDMVSEFIQSFNKDDHLDKSNLGDQRHFFKFPDKEQFRCAIPRPSQNLLFHDGRLTIFIEEVDG